jgi:hypothetical protein
MADSKTPPPFDDDTSSLSDEAPPDSAARPTSPPAEPSLLSVVAAPSDDPSALCVSREVLTAFLGKKATQARILQVVRARVRNGTQPSEVDDLVQKANLRAMTAKALPSGADRMRPWVSQVAAYTVIDHYREAAKETKADLRPISLEDVPLDEAVMEEPLDEGRLDAKDATFEGKTEPLDSATLVSWLGGVVTSAADLMTLEMIRCKAITGMTNAALAAEFGMTESAYDSRLLRFRSQWVPTWKKEKERRWRIGLLILTIVLLVAVAALARYVWPRLFGRIDPPARIEAPVPPAPIVTASAPPRFDQAAPPERRMEENEEKKEPPK